MTNIDALFANHIHELNNLTGSILESTKYDYLILSSGEEQCYFQDDKPFPFISNPHFIHWCPAKGPEHLLVISKTKKPRLIYFYPKDYWLEFLPPGNDPWTEQFSIEAFDTLQEVWNAVKNLKKVAFIGTQQAQAQKLGFDTNPPAVVNRLDWNRRYKSEYEVELTKQATKLAANGHRRAKQLFMDGASEMEIYFGYLEASQNLPVQTPFEPIVAINEKASILHYGRKNPVRQSNQSLLVDAGACYGGWCSDITRTHFNPNIPGTFSALRDGIVALKNNICALARPKQTYIELQRQTLLGISRLLMDSGIIRHSSPEEIFEKKICDKFMPHGIGHLLGIQVHDVSGRQYDPAGSRFVVHDRWPYLRFTGELEPRILITAEPGIYFNEGLLNGLRSERTQIDWNLVDQLKPLGGIRIEDNILISKDGAINLTREYLD